MAREMKKLVVKLDLHDDKEKKKALKTVSGSSGIDSLSVDMKEGKLTVTGDIDPVEIVRKLRKKWYTDILTVGPAKEPEKKKEEQKKDDRKKGDRKKDDGKKDEGKKDGGNKKKSEAEQMTDLVKSCEFYNHQMAARHCYPQYYVHSVEENPNACVIC